MSVKPIFRSILEAINKPIIQAPVGGGSGGPSVLFGSEWRFATGKTESAFRDGTRWQAYNGPADPTTTNAAAIVIATGLANRGNAFRIFNDGSNNLTVRQDNLLPAPFTTHYGRVYMRNNKTAGSHNHPIALGGLTEPATSIVCVPNLVTGSASGTVIQCQTLWKVDGSASGYRRTRWTPGVQGVAGVSYLTNNVWYLIEWMVEWLSSTRYALYVKVHSVDSNGMITGEDLFTTATFFWEDYFGVANGNLAATQISDTTMSGIATAGGNTRQYVFGNEGPGGGNTNGEYFEYASFGISTEDWLRDNSLGLS